MGQWVTHNFYQCIPNGLIIRHDIYQDRQNFQKNTQLLTVANDAINQMTEYCELISKRYDDRLLQNRSKIEEYKKKYTTQESRKQNSQKLKTLLYEQQKLVKLKQIIDNNHSFAIRLSTTIESLNVNIPFQNHTQSILRTLNGLATNDKSSENAENVTDTAYDKVISIQDVITIVNSKFQQLHKDFGVEVSNEDDSTLDTEFNAELSSILTCDDLKQKQLDDLRPVASVQLPHITQSSKRNPSTSSGKAENDITLSNNQNDDDDDTNNNTGGVALQAMTYNN